LFDLNYHTLSHCLFSSKTNSDSVCGSSDQTMFHKSLLTLTSIFRVGWKWFTYEIKHLFYKQYVVAYSQISAGS